jgi:hypothetical protein
MKIGFFSLMFLILLTLKLTEVITWSWWLIFLPLAGPLIGLFLALICICIAGGVLAYADMKPVKKNG